MATFDLTDRERLALAVSIIEGVAVEIRDDRRVILSPSAAAADDVDAMGDRLKRAAALLRPAPEPEL